MRNREVIEEVGYFWLPSTPGSKIPGTLHISEQGKVTLSAMGLFGDPAEASKANTSFKRIVGLINNQYVTLDSCRYKKNGGSFGGISKSIINASVAYLGVAYNDEETVSFSKVDLSVEGLDEWLFITGLQIEHNFEELSANISYKPPKKISIRLPEDIELAFAFSWSVSGGGTDFKEAKIKQDACMSLISSSSLPLKAFLSIISKLTNFLCFAIDKTVRLEFITGFSPNVTRQRKDADNEQVPIKVYFESVPYDETTRKIYWNDMLFRYDQVKDQLEEILAKWFSNYETSEPAFNLYFAYKSGAQRYIDGRFLSLAQGIETLHRRNSSKTVMPPDEFTKLIQQLLESCPNDKKEWFKNRIAYGNEISLRQRLVEMIEPFQSLYGSKQEVSAFINRVVDTRNYLTHYDQRSSDRLISGIEFWRLCMKLEVLFQLHFLRLMGLSNQFITSIVDAVDSLKWKLGQ